MLLLVVNAFIQSSGQATCNYNSDLFFYSCNPFVAQISNDAAITISGDHMTGLGDLDVVFLIAGPSDGTIIQVLPGEITQKFQNLQQLELVNVSLQVITERSFAHCPIAYLDLSSNQLATLPSRVFANCDSIGAMLLDNNQISTIEEEAFAGLDSLLLLSLTSNQLTRIGQTDFQNIPFLVLLGMDGNEIEEVHDEAFDSQAMLVVLTMNGNKLTQLDARVFQNNGELFLLDLGNNQLTTFSANRLNNLQALEALSLNGNQFASVDKDLFGLLPSLQLLQLESIPFTSFNVNTFEQLTSLEALSLRNNGFTQFDETLFDPLVNMQSLAIGANNLNEINPRLFEKLTSLVELDVGESRLGNLDFLKDDVFKTLTFLVCNDCDLTEIPVGTFSENMDLENLILSDNQITRLNSFGTLPELMMLNFTHSGIKEVERNFFSNFPKLEEFYFKNNDCIDMDSIDLEERDPSRLYPLFEICYANYEGELTTTTVGPTTPGPTTVAPTTIATETTTGAAGVTVSIVTLVMASIVTFFRQ